MEVSKMIDITDILDEIKFGYLSDMEWIVEANSLEENFRDLWKPIYHFFYGNCYMFESRNASLLSSFGDTFLRMILHFDVGSNLLRSIHVLQLQPIHYEKYFSVRKNNG